MKKYVVFLAVFSSLSILGLCFFSVYLDHKKMDISYTEETLEGDPEVLEGFVLFQSVSHEKSHNKWDHVVELGKKLRVDSSHIYDADPKIIFHEQPEVLQITSGIHKVGYSYCGYPVQMEDIYPKFYRTLITKVLNDAPEKGLYEVTVNAKDFFTYCPMTIFLDTKEGGYDSGNLEKIDNELKTEKDLRFERFYDQFTSDIKIPVKEDDRITVKIKKDLHGHLEEVDVSTDYEQKEWYSESVFSEKYCYLATEDRLISFKMDKDRIPIYDSKKEIYFLEDGKGRIRNLCISEDKNNIFLVVVSDKECKMNIYDNDTGNLIEEIQLFGKESRNVEILQKNQYLFIKDESNYFVVLMKDEDGSYKKWGEHQWIPLQDHFYADSVTFEIHGDKLILGYFYSCDSYLSVYNTEKLLYRGMIRNSQNDICNLTREYYSEDLPVHLYWQNP